jgi:putative two-component system response regulator
LRRVVEFRDEEAPGHIERVSRYADTIARSLDLGEDYAERIGLAATLHDAGKIALPDSILLAQGRLTPHQRKVMQQHTEVGYRLLVGSDYPLLDIAATIAWTHHEKFDGTGYPRGLCGDEIPLEGRIVTLSDVFDALTTERAYRSALSPETAFEVVRREGGGHFDPEVVQRFLAAESNIRRTMEHDYGSSFLSEEVRAA